MNAALGCNDRIIGIYDLPALCFQTFIVLVNLNGSLEGITYIHKGASIKMMSEFQLFIYFLVDFYTS